MLGSSVNENALGKVIETKSCYILSFNISIGHILLASVQREL